MTRTPHFFAFATAFAISAAPAISAQSHADSVQLAGLDSAKAPSKLGGMFHKAKGLANNKMVQSIAKGAACMALPGGQYIVAAVDAKQSKSAAGAASSAVGAATGAGCYPGMGAGNPNATSAMMATSATSSRTMDMKAINAAMLQMAGARMAIPADTSSDEP